LLQSLFAALAFGDFIFLAKKTKQKRLGQHKLARKASPLAMLTTFPLVIQRKKLHIFFFLCQNLTALWRVGGKSLC